MKTKDEIIKEQKKKISYLKKSIKIIMAEFLEYDGPSIRDMNRYIKEQLKK